MRLTEDIVRNMRMSKLTESAAPAAPLSGDEIKGMAHGLEIACTQCAFQSREPSDHLQTALFHFTRAVRHHHEGNHEVSRRAFDQAHAALQQPVAK